MCRHNPHNSFVWIKKRSPYNTCSFMSPPVAFSPLALAPLYSEQPAPRDTVVLLVLLSQPSAAGSL